MKIKIYHIVFTLIVVLLSYKEGFSQRRLEIGDTFPTLKLNNVYNYKDSVLDMSDFKGIPIIVDFWSTTCKSCLESFRKLDSLQRMFQGKVQFLLVNHQPFGPDSTDRLFKSRSALFKPAIPFITQDSILTALLEPVGMPYMTWIGADGIIKHFSNSVTSNAIHQLIQDKEVMIDPYVRHRQYPTSIFIDKVEPYIGYYSSITKRLPDMNPRNNIENACMAINNMDVLGLFRIAYGEGEGEFSRLGRTVLDVKDSTMFFKPKDDNERQKWYNENLYNYALALPEAKQYLKYEYMRQDLNRYFDVDAKVEQKKMKCYILRSLKDADKIQTKGGEVISYSTTVYSVGSSDNIREEYVLQNLPYKRFVSEIRILSEIRMKTPFVDFSTPLHANIDITFDGDLIVNPTFEKLQKFLLKHGYSITEEQLEIDVLVLKN